MDPEKRPLLKDSRKASYSSPIQPCGSLLSREISYDQLPSSHNSYCGDNYIFPPERSNKQEIVSRTESTSSKSTDFAFFNEIPRPHKPYFICAVSFINVILVIYECIHGGLITVSFVPRHENKTFEAFGCDVSAPNNINCPSNWSQTVARYSQVNGFIGPNVSFLIHNGALFTPCIREVSQIRKVVERITKIEKESCVCCEINGECGAYNFQTCSTRQGSELGKLENCTTSNPKCYNGVTLRPCCIGIHSHCSITTQESCDYQRGMWHKTKRSCSEVNCLEGICGMTGVMNKFKGNQGYRLMTAVFIHLGIIHVFVILLFQVPVGIMIEKQIGSIRMSLIYLINGYGGSVFSAIFDPLTPVAGASGALFGLMALILVQLIQYWRFVRHAPLSLLGLVILILFSLAIGTLPYIGNFVHIGGFIFGLFTSIYFVPSVQGYLSQRQKKWIFYLRRVSFVILLLLFVFSFVILYSVRDTGFCPWCRKLDCINWTKGFCPDLEHDGMA